MYSSQWVTVSRLHGEIEAAYALLCAEYRLSTPALHMLLALYERDGQRPTDLSRQIGYLATSITPILDRLEQTGFACRRVNDLDRRTLFVFLTQHAQELRGDITTEAAQIEDVVRTKVAQWAGQYQVAIG